MGCSRPDRCLGAHCRKKAAPILRFPFYTCLSDWFLFRILSKLFFGDQSFQLFFEFLDVSCLFVWIHCLCRPYRHTP